MNKLMIYSFLLLLYLVLSKSLSPSELGISYVNTEADLAKLIPGAPVTAILIDVHSTGFLIKTYYFKYKVIYGFQSYEELIVRTSSAFFNKYEEHVGLSTFRRYKDSQTENSIPLPPGTVFLSDDNFGRWVKNKSGVLVWKFSRVYRQIPVYLGWGDFSPTYDNYSQIQVHMKNNQVYTELKDVFGRTGSKTLESFPQYFERKGKYIMTWKDFLRNYFNENFINYKEKL